MDTFLFWSGTMDLLGMLSCMCDAADVFSAANYPPIAIMGSIAEQLGMMMAELRWCGTIATSGLCACLISACSVPCIDLILLHNMQLFL